MPASIISAIQFRIPVSQVCVYLGGFLPVVPAETQKQIRAVIERVGSEQYLAPLKAQLPEGSGSV